MPSTNRAVTSGPGGAANLGIMQIRFPIINLPRRISRDGVEVATGSYLLLLRGIPTIDRHRRPRYPLRTIA
jgi:hypothetical protein